MPNDNTELKGVLQNTILHLAKSGNASNQNVIRYVREHHSDLIQNNRTLLENIALRRISNDLVSTRNKAHSTSQADFFENDHGLKPLYSIKEGKKKKRLPTGSIKLSVLIRHFEEKIAAKAVKNKDKDQGTVDYLKAISTRVGPDDLTLDEVTEFLRNNR